MNTFLSCVCAAFIGVVAAAQPAAAQSSIADIEKRLAAQRAQTQPREATRGIEEFRPGQLRNSATAAPKETAAAPAAPASSATAAATPAQTRTEPGVSVAAAAPASAPAPRVISARDTAGQVIQVKVHDEATDISQPVRFALNSAFLTDQARGVLDVYCAAIKASEAKTGPAPGGYVLIGHADASGDAEYNRVLSQKRAEESRRYMVDSCGLPGAQLRAVGLGEEALKDPRRPTAAVNRRVELQIGS